MIGNDIIDLELSASESNWRRKGFLKKIFLEEEQEILMNSGKPDIFIWLMWSIKESAYKAHQRKFDLPRSFNPKDFKCKFNDIQGTSATGEVIIEDYIYFTNSIVSQNFVYSYACSIKNVQIKQKIKLNATNIKGDLMSSFSEQYKIKQDQIFLKKNEQFVPYLSYDQKNFCNLSLTHHGKYSAFIFELTNI